VAAHQNLQVRAVPVSISGLGLKGHQREDLEEEAMPKGLGLRVKE